MKDSVSRALVALTLLAAATAGCRAILGIEERTLDGGGGADAGDLSCASYCSAVMDACTGDNVQYASEAACLALCATMPMGAEDDSTGNTVGCRLNSARNVKLTGEVKGCIAAGPSGDDVCGSDCEAYCTSLEAICPTEFATFNGDCLSSCAAVPDCHDYEADPLRDDNSLQCRIFHLTSAAIDSTTHCPHTIAVGHCGFDADGGATDAGTLCSP